jgi:hypothetical protein
VTERRDYAENAARDGEKEERRDREMKRGKNRGWSGTDVWG